jgi:hypothetical protein
MNNLNKIEPQQYYLTMERLMWYAFPVSHRFDNLWIYYAHKAIPLKYLVIVASAGLDVPFTLDTLPDKNALINHFSELMYRIVWRQWTPDPVKYWTLSLPIEYEKELQAMKAKGTWYYPGELDISAKRCLCKELSDITPGDRIAIRVGQPCGSKESYPTFATVLNNDKLGDGRLDVFFESPPSVRVTRDSSLKANQRDSLVTRLESESRILQIFNEYPLLEKTTQPQK